MAQVSGDNLVVRALLLGHRSIRRATSRPLSSEYRGARNAMSSSFSSRVHGCLQGVFMSPISVVLSSISSLVSRLPQSRHAKRLQRHSLQTDLQRLQSPFSSVLMAQGSSPFTPMTLFFGQRCIVLRPLCHEMGLFPQLYPNVYNS